MARDVEDCALFLDNMTGFDPRIPLSLDAPAVSFQDALKQDKKNIRIAFQKIRVVLLLWSGKCVKSCLVQ
jgi:amidase